MASSKFKRVGVIGRQGSPQIGDSLAEVYRVLAGRECEILVESASAGMFGDGGVRGVKTDKIKTCDLIVVVGGDGSILGVAREYAASKIPVVGVNRGGLGFLADISPQEIEPLLNRVLDGEFRVEEHFLIQQRVVRGSKTVHESIALNDVVVSSGSLSRMTEFRLWIDDEFVYEQRSDGLLVATPTGSTAYSLSAGGSIMHPGLDAIAIIPLYPHALTSRPIVVPGDFNIRVEIGAETQGAKTNSDSQVEFELEPGDVVAISKFPDVLRLLHLSTQSFYEACRSKLDWGSRLGLRRD